VGPLLPRYGASSNRGWREIRLRRVAANVLNKQSLTADKLWSFRFRDERGASKTSP
jgi:hypothetical protein